MHKYKTYFMKCICQKAQATNFGLFALRLALGAVFMFHGYGKLMDIETTTRFFDMVGVPLPMVFAWVVGLVEFIGGALLILGVYVKTVALVTGFTMLLALILVHLGKPWAGAELAVLALGGSLALAGTGAGKWRILQKTECVCGAKACEKCSSSEEHKH
jgi:putative oxidoreductase